MSTQFEQHTQVKACKLQLISLQPAKFYDLTVYCLRFCAGVMSLYLCPSVSVTHMVVGGCSIRLRSVAETLVHVQLADICRLY